PAVPGVRPRPGFVRTCPLAPSGPAVPGVRPRPGFVRTCPLAPSGPAVPGVRPRPGFVRTCPWALPDCVPRAPHFVHGPARSHRRDPPHLPRAPGGRRAAESRCPDVLRERQEVVRDVLERPPRRRPGRADLRGAARGATPARRRGAGAVLPPCVRGSPRLDRRAYRRRGRLG